ncbi:uncharacterized protein (DUF952 family) [Arthrobacter pigmenti]|uniref:Uncharacterized protein (DUF952 family) n=1 Tax=Arthrobacter pigmenti TaxID=271432 RepID=A0A846RP72_9MICC|nr:DUF952 domain-containing protein [Arthrobacter pigmenti]NJC23380.1 uncharacterized protein (DUF952 family) [Arthrobacter pigmenti]
MRILHLAYASDWNFAAQADEPYAVSTRGATLDDAGFIHCAEPDQLAAVAESAYRDEADPSELLVLVMDSEQIESDGVDVRWEDGGAGVSYPHVYGPIKPEYVQDVLHADFDEDGRFRILDQ